MHVIRSLDGCLVLTLQTEDQSSTASPRSATSPDYNDDQPALPCGGDLLASGEENKCDWLGYCTCAVYPVYATSTLPVNFF